MLHLGNIAIAGGPQMGLAAAGAPSAPHLGMPDPEDARSAWISASISFVRLRSHKPAPATMPNGSSDKKAVVAKKA